jgi:succinoglycan biosynthesis protein ExoL
MKIAYLVQDLADAAIERRMTMLRRGGAEIDLYGFRRAGGAPAQVAGVVPRELGQTVDGKLGRRAFSVLAHSLTAGEWAKAWAGADVIIARNLDNLVLAEAARRRLGLKTPLIYELLDIHTVMFRDDPLANLLRAIEGRLLRASDAVIISSPAFERDYLARYHRRHPGVLHVENKVLSDSIIVPPVRSADGPPWRIGWFGGIRCKQSLDSLSRLVRAHPGLFEVHIRGRFTNPHMGDVHGIIRDSPGIYYHGAYKSPEDLPKIYGEVHFAWAVDFCQEGANSDWLLPNRLYEGGLHGAVPIALRGVETGRWLERRGVGLLIDASLEESVFELLSTMTPQAYRDAAAQLRALDRGAFQWTDAECSDLVRQLAAAGRSAAPASA